MTAAVVAAVAAILPESVVHADPVACGTATYYLRVEAVNASGTPSGSYVDTRCPGRMLAFTPEFRYAVHVGHVKPNTQVVIDYYDPDGHELIETTAASATTGRFGPVTVEVYTNARTNGSSATGGGQLQSVGAGPRVAYSVAYLLN